MDKQLSLLLSNVFSVTEAEITMDATKADLANWDSLKQMDLVTTLEREYSITLELMDIVGMNSVATIVNVLSEKGVTLEN